MSPTASQCISSRYVLAASTLLACGVAGIGDRTVKFCKGKNHEGGCDTYSLPSSQSVKKYNSVTSNDKYSSVELGSKIYVRVYQNSNLNAGKQGDAFSDIVQTSATMKKKGKHGWNDKISSFEIRTFPENYAVLFKDESNDNEENYEPGHAVLLEEETLFTSDLNSLQIGGGEISEIHLGGDMTITLYSEDSFHGSSFFLPGPVKQKLKELSWHDRAKSAKIRRASSVYAVSGNWVKVVGFNQGNTAYNYKVLTTSTEESWSEVSFTDSLVTAVEAGYEYGGASGSVSVTKEQSKTTAQGMRSSIEQTSETSAPASCSTDKCHTSLDIYQWVMEANRGTKTTTVNSFEYRCQPKGTPPVCIVGECEDKYCQVCTSNLPSEVGSCGCNFCGSQHYENCSTKCAGLTRDECLSDVIWYCKWTPEPSKLYAVGDAANGVGSKLGMALPIMTMLGGVLATAAILAAAAVTRLRFHSGVLEQQPMLRDGEACDIPELSQ